MELNLTHFRGEIAALTGAALWATSTLVYNFIGAKIPPLLLNLAKGLIAIAFILLTFIISDYHFSPFNASAILGLTISGLIGIGIGDTAYFQALNHLGARKTLLLETLAPPITAFLAFIFIGETLNPSIWLGMMITITGIAWVISERNLPDVKINRPEKTILGIKWACTGVLSQAVGAVIIRYILSDTEIAPLESALIRLIGGTIIVLILMVSQHQPIVPIVKSNWSWKLVLILITTAFGSTYLGIWLQQTAFKFAPAGIAHTLLATSPLFVLPLVIALGEKVSFRAVIGAIMTLLGVGLLFA